MYRENKSLSHIRRFCKRLGSTGKYTQNLGYMAYNNRNKLLIAKAVQKLVLAGQKRGATQKWVYENEVNPIYPMSYSTFNNYLSVNVRLEQEKTEKRLAEIKEAKLKAEKRRNALLGQQLSIEFV